MTQAFTESPLHAFIESPLHARGSSPSHPFVFQWLLSSRAKHNTDGSPWGFQLHGGQGISDPFPDPRGATFATPLAFPNCLTKEFWSDVSSVPPTNPPIQLQRSFPGIVPGGVLTRSGNGWLETNVIASRQWDILFAQKISILRLAGTDPVYGDFFPADIWDDRITRLKIYPHAGGVATFHTFGFDNTSFDFGSGTPLLLPNASSGSSFAFPPPHTIKERKAGDPAEIYEPDEPEDSQYNWAGNGPGTPANFSSFGTFETVLFWFGLKASDLPTFPFIVNLIDIFGG